MLNFLSSDFRVSVFLSFRTNLLFFILRKGWVLKLIY